MWNTNELTEAEKLLSKVAAWSEDEVEELPLFYRRKAQAYRQRAATLGIE